MPKGPQGQKRPADSIGCAVLVAQIAIGESLDSIGATGDRSSGGLARSKNLTSQERSKIAKKAANARWKNDS